MHAVHSNPDTQAATATLFWRATPAYFAAQRNAVMDAKGGLQSLGLTRHSPAHYATHARCYLSDDGLTGFAVTHDGDLESLFNGGAPGMGRAAVQAAVAFGARTLWCFDGFLPRYYASLGWRECGRLEWDDSLAPAGWPYDVHGRPDVVKMAYGPEPRTSVYPPAPAAAVGL